ncbi:MAG TPA: low affinity iron permease family protein [Terriglobales bacterium]
MTTNDHKQQEVPRKTSDWFAHFSNTCSSLVGSRWAFIAALGIIVVWGVSGPVYHYSNTWQLVINTGTTIITFLIVFLIQNTQNRDAKAINLKLNEIIRSIGKAQNDLIDIEKLSDGELDRLAAQYERIREQAELRRKRKHETLQQEIKLKVKSELKDELKKEVPEELGLKPPKKGAA